MRADRLTTCRRQAKLLRWAVWAFLGIALLPVLVNPARFSDDDGYFYLVIARNIVSGLGSTFHGLGPTNGYHPLWEALCSGIVAVSGEAYALHAAVACQVVLLLVALVILDRCAHAWRWPLSGAWAPLAGLWLGTNPNYLSEFALAVLAQAAALYAWTRWSDKGGTGRAVLLGLALGITVLARLDLVFFAGGVLLLQGVEAFRRRRPADAFVAALVCLVALAPYLAWNALSFGHGIPVSGLVKSSFPFPSWDLPWRKLGGQGAVLLAGSLLVLAFLGFTRRRGSVDRARPVLAPLAALAIGASLHGLYTAVFTRPDWSQDYLYYYTTAGLAVSGALCFALHAYVARLSSFSQANRRRLVDALVLLVALIATVRTMDSAFDRCALAGDDPVVSFARRIDLTLPEDAVIWTLDAPGRLAWYGRRPTLAADGLTHVRSFGSDLGDPDAVAWLERMDVTHAVVPRTAYAPPWATITVEDAWIRVLVRDPSTGEPRGEVWLRDADRLGDLSSSPGFDPEDQMDVGLWARPEGGWIRSM